VDAPHLPRYEAHFDESITTPRRVKFFVSRRVGGHVLDNHAVKFIQTA
jgi:predicted phage gp36 major capsid-like protein